MSEILGLEHLAILPTGPTLMLTIAAGQSLAIVGPAGAGKSRLMRTIMGIERCAQGSVRTKGEVVFCGEEGINRRSKPQTLARRSGFSGQAAKATEILMVTRLWDVRHEAVADLSPAQVAACELIEPLSSDADLILLDGQLDRLDPWALQSVLERMKQLQQKGAVFVVSTNRPELLNWFDAVVVLKEKQVRFAGTVTDLLRSGPPHTLQVATDNQPGVRSLVSPFEVSVQTTPDGLRLEAGEGQGLAARLLLEGYGDVKFVVLKPPTIEEALLSLL